MFILNIIILVKFIIKIYNHKTERFFLKNLDQTLITTSTNKNPTKKIFEPKMGIQENKSVINHIFLFCKKRYNF